MPIRDLVSNSQFNDVVSENQATVVAFKSKNPQHWEDLMPTFESHFDGEIRPNVVYSQVDLVENEWAINRFGLSLLWPTVILFTPGLGGVPTEPLGILGRVTNKEQLKSTLSPEVLGRFLK